MACYALVFGPKQGSKAKWVPAFYEKVLGPRSVTVRVVSGRHTWRRHVDQLRPRHGDLTEGATISGNNVNMGTIDSGSSTRPKRIIKPKVPFNA